MNIQWYNLTTNQTVSKPSNIQLIDRGSPSSNNWNNSAICYVDDGGGYHYTGWYQSGNEDYRTYLLRYKYTGSGTHIVKVDANITDGGTVDSNLVSEAYGEHVPYTVSSAGGGTRTITLSTNDKSPDDDEYFLINLSEYTDSRSVADDIDGEYEEAFSVYRTVNWVRIYVSDAQFTVNVSVDGDGAASCDKNPYNHAEVATLTATDTSADYTFDKWTNSSKQNWRSTDNPYSFTVWECNDDAGHKDSQYNFTALDFTAVFKYTGPAYDIYAQTSGSGNCTVNGTYALYDVKPSETVTVRAYVSSGASYACLYVVGSFGVRIDNPNLTSLTNNTNDIIYSYQPSEDATWTATFNSFVTITCHCNGTVISERPGYVGLTYGEYEALPTPSASQIPAGKRFVGWANDSYSTTPNVFDSTTVSRRSGINLYAILVDDESSSTSDESPSSPSDTSPSSDDSSDDSADWSDVEGDILDFEHIVTGLPDGQEQPDPIADCTGHYKGRYKKGTEIVYGNVTFNFANITGGLELEKVEVYAGETKIGEFTK